MSRTAMIGAGLLAVPSLLWWLALSEREPSRVPVADSEPEPEVAAVPAPQAAKPEPARPAPEQTVTAEPAPHPPAEAPAELVQTPVPVPSGPIAELKARFEREPRDNGAARLEGLVREAFADRGTAAELLKSVLCRQSICRLELRWTPQRQLGYLVAMSRLTSEFHSEIAISPIDPPGGVMLVEVYWPRRQSQGTAP